jgi:hypothetical protein
MIKESIRCIPGDLGWLLKIKVRVVVTHPPLHGLRDRKVTLAQDVRAVGGETTLADCMQKAEEFALIFKENNPHIRSVFTEWETESF